MAMMEGHVERAAEGGSSFMDFPQLLIRGGSKAKASLRSLKQLMNADRLWLVVCPLASFGPHSANISDLRWEQDARNRKRGRKLLNYGNLHDFGDHFAGLLSDFWEAWIVQLHSSEIISTAQFETRIAGFRF